MANRYNANTQTGSHKKMWIILGVLVVVIAVGLAYWRLEIYKPASEVITTAGNTSPSAENNSSANSPTPNKEPTSNTGHTIGGSTDTNGQSSVSTSPNQWVTSKSGVITVKQPTANSVIKSGDILSGTAKVGTVNFRLIDNNTGVIAEGTLNVVNGKFSGKLGFNLSSTSGRLDVFSTAADGTEINEIQIAVRY